MPLPFVSRVSRSTPRFAPVLLLDSRFLSLFSSLSLVSLAPPSYFSSISCFFFFIPQLLLVVFARSFGERPDKFLVKSSDTRTTIYRLVEWDFRETFVKRCTLKGPWMNFGGFYREREREREIRHFAVDFRFQLYHADGETDCAQCQIRHFRSFHFIRAAVFLRLFRKN